MSAVEIEQKSYKMPERGDGEGSPAPGPAGAVPANWQTLLHK